MKQITVTFSDGQREVYNKPKDYQESLYGDCIRIVTSEDVELILPLQAIKKIEKS